MRSYPIGEVDVKSPSQPEDVIWRPGAEQLQRSCLAGYQAWLEDERGLKFDSYLDLWSWSTDDLAQFWASIVEYFAIEIHNATTVLRGDAMPAVEWYPGATINYAAHLLRHATAERPAAVVWREGVEPHELSWAALSSSVGGFADYLRAAGVGPGDAVAAYLPNVPEAIAALGGCASVGAVFSICAPDFGTEAVLNRFRQLRPKVLLVTDGYRFRGREFDRRAEVDLIRRSLPTVEHVVWVPNLWPREAPAVPDAVSWSEVSSSQRPPQIDQLPFGHPLWVLFTSGSTGAPKGIVHGHGGVVLEHIKSLALQLDIRAGDRVLMVSSTSWMVWNIMVAGLLVGATIMVVDGDPTLPDLGALWRAARDHKATHFLTSSGFIHACMNAQSVVDDSLDLSALRMVAPTGSPLSPAAFRWLVDKVKRDVQVAPTSGGTDVASAFVGPVPTLPVRAGRIQGPWLGVAVQCWTPEGRNVRNQLGELVVTRPMPSMPIRFWDDPDGARYRDSYFAQSPGVWTHGDLIEFDDDGSCVIPGRSDATLNRQGIRIGPADIYAIVESRPEVREAMILGVERPDGAYFMPLYVALADGHELTESLSSELAGILRRELSPRHVPDVILAVPAIPHTKTGKKLEVPMKRLLQGSSLEQVVALGAVDDADAVRTFAEIALANSPL